MLGFLFNKIKKLESSTAQLSNQAESLNTVIVKGISHTTRILSSAEIGTTGADGTSHEVSNISVPCRITSLTVASVKASHVVKLYIKNALGELPTDPLLINYPWLTDAQKKVSVINLATYAANESEHFKVQLNTTDKYVLYLKNTIECPHGYSIVVEEAGEVGELIVDILTEYYAVESEV